MENNLNLIQGVVVGCPTMCCILGHILCPFHASGLPHLYGSQQLCVIDSSNNRSEWGAQQISIRFVCLQLLQTLPHAARSSISIDSFCNASCE
jgi:hypothetical protein